MLSPEEKEKVEYLKEKTNILQFKENVIDFLSSFEDNTDGSYKIEKTSIISIVSHDVKSFPIYDTDEEYYTNYFHTIDKIPNNFSIYLRFVNHLENEDIKHSKLRNAVRVEISLDNYSKDWISNRKRYLESLRLMCKIQKSFYGTDIMIISADEIFLTNEKRILENWINDQIENRSASGETRKLPSKICILFIEELDPKLLCEKDPTESLPKNLIIKFNEFTKKFNMSNRDKKELINLFSSSKFE